MTELWVTSIVVGSGVLVAGLAGFAASFLVPSLADRQLAMRVGDERFGPNDVGRPETTEPRVGPVTSFAPAFAGAGALSFADREMAHARSTTT